MDVASTTTPAATTDNYQINIMPVELNGLTFGQMIQCFFQALVGKGKQGCWWNSSQPSPVYLWNISDFTLYLFLTLQIQEVKIPADTHANIWIRGVPPLYFSTSSPRQGGWSLTWKNICLTESEYCSCSSSLCGFNPERNDDFIILHVCGHLWTTLKKHKIISHSMRESLNSTRITVE